MSPGWALKKTPTITFNETKIELGIHPIIVSIRKVTEGEPHYKRTKKKFQPDRQTVKADAVFDVYKAESFTWLFVRGNVIVFMEVISNAAVPSGE